MVFNLGKTLECIVHDVWILPPYDGGEDNAHGVSHGMQILSRPHGQHLKNDSNSIHELQNIVMKSI